MEKYKIKAKVEMEIEVIVFKAGKPNKDDIAEYIKDEFKGTGDVENVIVTDLELTEI